jgi:hypothetical protein
MTISGNVSSAGLCYSIDIVLCPELLGCSVSMVKGLLDFKYFGSTVPQFCAQS